MPAGVSYWASRPRVQRFVSDWLSLQRSHLREWVAGVHFDPLDIFQRRSDQVHARHLCAAKGSCLQAASAVSAEHSCWLLRPDPLWYMQVTFNKYAVPHMLSNYPGEEPYVRISALDQLVSQLLVSGRSSPLPTRPSQQGPSLP